MDSAHSATGTTDINIEHYDMDYDPERFSIRFCTALDHQQV